MLLHHWPNGRTLSDIKAEDTSWTTALQNFLETGACPNFLKAEIERAKKPIPETNDEDDEINETADDNSSQPEWMQLIKPRATFDDIQPEISFDDGGPDFD